MPVFEYEVLTRRPKGSKLVWVRLSKPTSSLGANVRAALNRVGRAGWEAVGCGDVIGTDSRTEIILKRQKG